jgi:tripartite-type tricarboxylate transporter receptor subunit TctC
MSMFRIAICALAAAFSIFSGVFAAEAWPTKAIRIIVPFPPGNASDLAARALTDRLAQRLGRPVIVENRAGAQGAIGVEAVAKAPADGYTLLITSLSPLVITPHVSKDLTYDALRDLAPVARIAWTSLILVATPSFPANTVQELIAYGRANPGKLTYASLGAGTISMLPMEVFKHATGLDILHVPYKGSGQATVDLIGGQVPLMFDGMTSSYGHVKNGRLKALAISATKRSVLAPEIPTLRESGMSGLNDTGVEGWIGMLAPMGTPVAIIERLNAEVNLTLEQADFKTRANGQSLDVYAPSSAAQFSAFIRKEHAYWGAAVKPLKLE